MMKKITHKLPNGFVETVFNQLIHHKRVVYFNKKPIVETNVVMKKEKQSPIYKSPTEQKGNSFISRNRAKLEAKYREKAYEAQLKANELLLQLVSNGNGGNVRNGGRKKSIFGALLKGIGKGGKFAKNILKLGSKLGLGIIGKVGKVLFKSLSPLKFVALATMAYNYLKDGFTKRTGDYEKYKKAVGNESHGVLSKMVGYSASLLSDVSEWLSDVTGGVIPSISESEAFAYADKLETSLLNAYNKGVDAISEALTKVSDYLNISQSDRDVINQKIQDWLDNSWRNIGAAWDKMLTYTGFDAVGRREKDQWIETKISNWYDIISTKISDTVNELLMKMDRVVDDTLSSLTDPIKEKYHKIKDNVFGKEMTKLEELTKQIEDLTNDIYMKTSKSPNDRLKALFTDDTDVLEKRLTDVADQYNKLLMKTREPISVEVEVDSIATTKEIKEAIKREMDKIDPKSINHNKINKATGKKGGSISWRNNNQGNLKYEYTGIDTTMKGYKGWRSYEKALKAAQRNDKGVIGLDRFGFAMFDTEEHGQMGQKRVLKKNFGKKTIHDMLRKYAVDDESGSANHSQYEKDIFKYAKEKGVFLPRNKKINTFTDEQLHVLANGMKGHEGYKVGKPIEQPVTKDANGKLVGGLRELIVLLKEQNTNTTTIESVKRGDSRIEFVDDIGNQGKV